MPTCVFILSRLILRVDNVLFRVHDTRIYHSFESSPPLVVRETSGWEAPYDRVKQVRGSKQISDRFDVKTLLSASPETGRLDAADGSKLHRQGAFGNAQRNLAGRRGRDEMEGSWDQT